MGPNFLEDYRRLLSKRMKSDKHMNILAAAYTSSIFVNIAAYLRTEIDLIENDIRLVVDEHNSSFIT